MNKYFVLLLPVLALLVTGCPRNEYTLELKPHGNEIQRTLVFYRADGEDSNGAPKYETFPQEELAAITTVYPADGVTAKKDVHNAKGEFGGAMPSDIGGAGSYTNLVTSMGRAGFYGERFRGNDDLATPTEKRIAAANKLVDIVIGWSEAELGRETNYAALRKFLDGDFRRDVENAAFYWKQAGLNSQANTNTAEEFEVRFAQYLLERGYFKMADVPKLFSIATTDGDVPLQSLLQRLVARKLGVDDAQPLPACLAFLHDHETTEKSFEKYFVGTDLYQARFKEWKKNPKASEQKPEVTDVMGEVFNDLLDWKIFGDADDHLTVKLSLPEPPTRTNGRWDKTNRLVVWDCELENKTNSVRLPVICYASWGQAEEGFQKRHFGGVVLTGENLVEYCLWRAGQDEKRAAEWDQFLAALQPDAVLRQKVKGFRFTDESISPDAGRASPSYTPRSLLEQGLGEK